MPKAEALPVVFRSTTNARGSESTALQWDGIVIVCREIYELTAQAVARQAAEMGTVTAEGDHTVTVPAGGNRSMH